MWLSQSIYDFNLLINNNLFSIFMNSTFFVVDKLDIEKNGLKHNL
jgi:hypothetical protein